MKWKSACKHIHFLFYQERKNMKRKTELSRVKSTVERILRRNPESRDNYNVLFVEYFRETGQSLNLIDHIDDLCNQFDSIARARRKIQQSNPFLKDKEFVEDEQEFREWAREEI